MSEARTLFVSSFPPVLGGGRAVRTYTCIRALAMLGPLDLAYVEHDGEGPSPEYRAIEGVTFHRIEASRGARRAGLYLSKRLQAVPKKCCRGTSPELVDTAVRLASEPGRGRVIAGDMAAAVAFLPDAARRPFVYNAHNVESEYVDRDVKLRRLAFATMRRFERRLLLAASESWMVSQTDIRSAQRLAPAAHLRYVPNVVDVGAIVPRDPAAARAGDGPPTLLMVGDFHYLPNVSGLEMLVESVLPLVWQREPRARLRVVGRGLDAWRAPDARVQVEGFVEDLAPCYEQADCVVVPLTEGAGTPLKFVEALAYGVPIVATPLAAKGLQVTPDVHYRSGADAQGFADSIMRNLSDDAAELGRNARLLAEREYSIEALAKAVAA
jgi:glycosyltransferase involved in cell wall biosynthesis